MTYVMSVKKEEKKVEGGPKSVTRGGPARYTPPMLMPSARPWPSGDGDGGMGRGVGAYRVWEYL